MIIDFHTHIFSQNLAPRAIAQLEKTSGNKAFTDGTAEGLLASMDAEGIDKAVAAPVVTRPSQFHTVNTFSQKINQEYGQRLIAFGGIHPECEDYLDELEKIRDMGLLGIKLHPVYHGMNIDDVQYMNIIDYANQLGLIILTHTGHDMSFPQAQQCTPRRIRRVIDELKPEKFVLAHLGGFQMWDEAFEYLAGTNVYLDTSYTINVMGQDKLWEILMRHDKKKILFGTDSPWTNAQREIEAVRRLPLETAVKEDILGKNAQCLLGL